jgi:molybdopterin/thiamine biosynthesis adenylyltransferase
MTPEYLSVVCRATIDDRSMLVEYLSRLNPGRVCVSTPYGFGSDQMKNTYRASVGAVGSGDNDVKMLKAAKVAFSTS